MMGALGYTISALPLEGSTLLCAVNHVSTVKTLVIKAWMNFPGWPNSLCVVTDHCQES